MTPPPLSMWTCPRFCPYVVRRLIEGRAKKYVIDWDSVYLDRDRFLELRDPFRSYRQEAEQFARAI